MKTTATIATIMSEVSAFFTGAIDWIEQVVDVVTSNPLLLIMVVCMPVAGVAIGYLKRLIRL